MDLDELKKSMSTLDDILAENNGETSISFDISKCDTARNRIMKQYRKGAANCIIFAIVFLVLWGAGLGQDAFPLTYKLYLGSFMAAAAVWYIFLYLKTKKINVAVSTPMQTMRQVASLRFCALAGEIVLGIAIVVFFTLFLSNLWVVGRYRFWIVVSALAIFIVVGVIFYLPKTIRDFNNLTSTR